ncbi:hypothetical protein N7G274_010933 [Stereocaulon virgatum]
MGYTDLGVFHNPMLQRIIAGIRRCRGEAETKERRPITRDLLLKMLILCDRSTLAGANLYAAFCLAFAGSLRIGEFTYSADERADPDFASWFLIRRSITLHEDRLELSLPASKPTILGKGSLSLSPALTTMHAQL